MKRLLGHENLDRYFCKMIFIEFLFSAFVQMTKIFALRSVNACSKSYILINIRIDNRACSARADRLFLFESPKLN